MLQILRLVLGTITRLFSTRRSLVLENLALRQQLVVFKRRHCKPRLRLFDNLFWVAARQVWSDWKQSLILVRPETVVQWHRSGFKLYWRVLSRTWRPPAGRPRISKEIRDLMFKMVAENPTWGAPQIHGELLMLGFDVSERTISRWMRQAPRDPEPAKRWLAFLRNHREAIAAMDFFTDHVIALKRGPHASWTWEGNTERQNSFSSVRSGPFRGTIGRPPPPL